MPLPDTLTWEMGNVASFDRAHWLRIDRLGAQKTDAKTMADLNEMAMPPSPDFGAHSIGNVHPRKTDEAQKSLQPLRCSFSTFIEVTTD